MIFYESFWNAIKDLPDSDRLASFDAIVSYGLTGIDPNPKGIAKVVFAMAKPQIDANEQRRRNGSKGGRPRKTESQTEEIRYEDVKKRTKDKKENEDQAEDLGAKEEDPIAEQEKLKSEPVEEKRVRKEKKEKPVKHKYGEYKNVLLSDEEMEKLKKEFPNDWNERIENLSAAIASKGYHYTNFLATIRNWARRDKNRSGPVISQNNTNRNSFVNFKQSGTNWDDAFDQIIEHEMNSQTPLDKSAMWNSS